MDPGIVSYRLVAPGLAELKSAARVTVEYRLVVVGPVAAGAAFVRAHSSEQSGSEY